MFQGDPQHTGVATSPIALPLSLSWRYVTNRAIPGTNAASPIVISSLGPQPIGFFAARDLIASLRLDTGEARWFYPSQGSLGAGKQATIKRAPARAGEIQRSSLAADKAARELAWRPRTPLAEGLRATIRSIMEA